MSIDRIAAAISAWMDLVAATLVGIGARLRRVRAVELAEGAEGTFALRSPGTPAPAHPPFRLDGGAAGLPDGLAAELKGQDIELVLDPALVLFRPLELPKRAAEFLDGIVRAQIDRLTPWSASEAAFGWTAPRDAADDRIEVTVAATARARIDPLLETLKALGANAVTVSTGRAGEAGEAVRIQLLRHAAAGVLDAARVRRALVALVTALAAIAVLCVGAAQIVGANLDAQLDDLDRRIAAQRLVLAKGRGGEARETSALRALEQRKHDSAATVLVLEALSKVLPDDTYLTELHVDADKLQVSGISRDVPALVRLLEQSSRFAQATFFAPTTRAPQDPGERFHIEARIKIPFEARR